MNEAIRTLLQRKADLLAEPYPHNKPALRQVNRDLARMGIYRRDQYVSALSAYGIVAQRARTSNNASAS